VPLQLAQRRAHAGGVMSIEQLADRIPNYAKDLKLNLGSVLRQTELTEQQLWGTAVTCALTARNADVTAAVLAEAQAHLSPQAFEAAKSAAAIMGMNNVYYRFQHMMTDEKYRTIPARLRMQVIRSHGVDQADFELWCTAASAINNCHVCAASHEKVVREKGITEEAIVAAVRIAAVLHAVAGVMDAEAVIPAAAPAVSG
jgi:alkyl hydroperoxide reductase subunit D